MIKDPRLCVYTSTTSWWFPPIWKRWSSNWIMKPQGSGWKYKMFELPPPRLECIYVEIKHRFLLQKFTSDHPWLEPTGRWRSGVMFCVWWRYSAWKMFFQEIYLYSDTERHLGFWYCLTGKKQTCLFLFFWYNQLKYRCPTHIILYWHILTSPMEPWNKSLNFIFPILNM